MQLTTFLTAANAVMLLALLFVYWKSVQKVRSGFTYGLALFALLFLLQSLASLYFYATNMPYYANMVELHVFILTILQAIAFAVMNWLAWK